MLANIRTLSHNDATDSKLLTVINKAILNTQAHQTFSVTMHTVFEVEKPSESLLYRQFDKKLGNKFLLWHGCKQTSLVATFRQGLQIPSLESASTGLMFGKGIYLTDCFSKAANKSQNRGEQFGIVFLVEAALGQMHLAYSPDQFKNGAPSFNHSVYGVG